MSPNRRFVQGSIWRLLQRRPGIGIHAIGQAIGTHPDLVSSLMRKLRHKGCVRLEGYGPSACWYAIGTEPLDDRGIAAGTHAVLRRHSFKRGNKIGRRFGEGSCTA